MFGENGTEFGDLLEDSRSLFYEEIAIEGSIRDDIVLISEQILKK